MNDFSPIDPSRAFEAAIDQIADRIRRGELKRGDRLPSERELAAAMQISRPSLREAIRALADADVLRVQSGPSGGIFVASTYVPREVLKSNTELRMDEVRAVLEARRLFEPRVAQLAAVHARDEDFERLQETIDAQEAMLRAGSVAGHEDRFLEHDIQFHLRVAGATHNSTILAFMRILQERLEFARDLVIREPPTPSWVVGIHKQTLAAIRTADHDRIQEVMDEHLAELEHAWERSTNRPLLRPLPEFMLPLADRVPSQP